MSCQFFSKSARSMIRLFLRCAGPEASKIELRALSGEVASLSSCLYPNRCRVNNVRHCRFRIRCNTANVDFAKHIGVFAVFFLRTQQEIAIPENRKALGINSKQSLRCWYQLQLKLVLKSLEFQLGRRMVQSVSRLVRLCWRCVVR